jgi:hypothetical protein
MTPEEQKLAEHVERLKNRIENLAIENERLSYDLHISRGYISALKAWMSEETKETKAAERIAGDAYSFVAGGAEHCSVDSRYSAVLRILPSKATPPDWFVEGMRHIGWGQAGGWWNIPEPTELCEDAIERLEDRGWVPKHAEETRANMLNSATLNELAVRLPNGKGAHPEAKERMRKAGWVPASGECIGKWLNDGVNGPTAGDISSLNSYGWYNGNNSLQKTIVRLLRDAAITSILAKEMAEIGWIQSSPSAIARYINEGMDSGRLRDLHGHGVGHISDVRLIMEPGGKSHFDWNDGTFYKGL